MVKLFFLAVIHISSLSEIIYQLVSVPSCRQVLHSGPALEFLDTIELVTNDEMF